MSVSSNSRKESTESYAAQQMHSTMGIAPELGQLNDKNLENELPSRVAENNDTDVPGDVAKAESLVAENDDKKEISSEDIEESKRASWGQPPLPNDAEEATTDEDSPMTAYQQPEAADESVTVSDADWNRSTSEETIPVTKINEPDRTLGNS